jgi:hypothetical protein
MRPRVRVDRSVSEGRGFFGWRVGSGAAACWALSAALLVAAPSQAHHLELSRLELRPQADDMVRARLFLDPRLPLSSRGSAEQELSALVAHNLHLAAAGRGCELDVKVLEIWRENSASAGHVVDVACYLHRPPGLPLTVSLGKGLGKVLLSFPEERQDRVSAEREVLARPGGDTEVLLGRTKSQVQRSGAFEWLRLGFEHVLPDGLDHVLFVMSLVLGAFHNVRALALSVLAFTVGHALGLYLAVLGLVDPAPGLVEPLIALSIVALAGLVLWQLLRGGALSGRALAKTDCVPAGLPVAHRWPLAAWFGVVHGLGFAGAFSALRVARSELTLTLVQFHVGVELGHLVVLLLAWLWFQKVVPRLAVLGQVRESSILLSFALALSSTGLALFAERLQENFGGN